MFFLLDAVITLSCNVVLNVAMLAIVGHLGMVMLDNSFARELAVVSVEEIEVLVLFDCDEDELLDDVEVVADDEDEEEEELEEEDDGSSPGSPLRPLRRFLFFSFLFSLRFFFFSCLSFFLLPFLSFLSFLSLSLLRFFPFLSSSSSS